MGEGSRLGGQRGPRSPPPWGWSGHVWVRPWGSGCRPSPALPRADQHHRESFLVAVVSWEPQKRAGVSGEPLAVAFTTEHSRSRGARHTLPPPPAGVAGSWKGFSKAMVSFGKICRVTWPAEKLRFEFYQPQTSQEGFTPRDGDSLK